MVVVSAGREIVHVPDVEYKKSEDAGKLLEGCGLEYEIEYENNDTVAAGNVIRQSE